jgi:hypothetical protein
VIHLRQTAWMWVAPALMWSTAIAAGWVTLLRYDYESRPHESGPVPACWPTGTRIERDHDRGTLVMFAHPRCPCTRASIGELALLMAQCQGRLRAHVLFFRPVGSSELGASTDLSRSAAAIPGVTVAQDDGGAEARRFHVATSGHTLLYGARGELLFSGGITASRGHSGGNAGRSAVFALLHDGVAELEETPAFGCSLRDPESPREGWTASWHKPNPNWR